VGAVPAFGSLYGLPTILDETIERDKTIVFEGNTHSHAIKMSCKNYERLERPRWLAFSVPLPAATETAATSESTHADPVTV
jgi:Ala-tRNA(Pro) deacylase